LLIRPNRKLRVGARPGFFGIGRFLQVVIFTSVTVSDIRRNTEESIRQIVEDAIVGTDLYIVEITVRGHTGSIVVDIYLDSDKGLSVDTLADMNREIGFLLELNEVISGKYRLNVSSPGIDRPLSLPRQYYKNRGRQLDLRCKEPDGSGTQKITGVLVVSDEVGIEIQMNESNRRRIPYSDILLAKVKLPW